MTDAREDLVTEVNGSPPGRGFPFLRSASIVAVLLAVMQPRAISASFTNLARIFEIRAIERPVRLLEMDANRAAAVIVSQHLERDIFTPAEHRSLAAAQRFARLSEAVSADSGTALAAGRLSALLGDHVQALAALAGPPPANLAGARAVLVATLEERLGNQAARHWSDSGDTSASYFLDLSRYLSQRGDIGAADESLRRAVGYARSPNIEYVVNYRMALHKMYGLNQAAASLPYFSHADSLRLLVPPAVADAFGFHLSYAHALLNARQFPDAVVHASRAVDLNPRDPHAQELMGRAYLDTGNLSQAKKAYTVSITLYQASQMPVPGFTYLGLAQTDLALGDRLQARDMFARALESGVPDGLRTYITEVLAGLDHADGR